MIFVLAALLVGVVAGLRAMTAPAVPGRAAQWGALHLAATPLAFLGWYYSPWVLFALALRELITDQLPSTPSRKVPAHFGRDRPVALLEDTEAIGGAIPMMAMLP